MNDSKQANYTVFWRKGRRPAESGLTRDQAIDRLLTIDGSYYEIVQADNDCQLLWARAKGHPFETLWQAKNCDQLMNNVIETQYGICIVLDEEYEVVAERYKENKRIIDLPEKEYVKEVKRIVDQEIAEEKAIDEIVAGLSVKERQALAEQHRECSRAYSLRSMEIAQSKLRLAMPKASDQTVQRLRGQLQDACKKLLSPTSVSC